MLKLVEAVEEIRCGKKMFYVYVLHKPAGTPFYVGKGKIRQKDDHRQNDQRIVYHEKEARANGTWKKQPHFNRHKLNTISKIWRQGKEVFYSIDSWHDTEESCYAREKELIRSLGRRITGDGPLTNLTEGGEKEMASVATDTREQISASLKQYYQEHPEVLEAMSERGKEQFASEEAKEKVRENNAENKNHEYLVKWREEKPEERLELNKQHADFMKQWHAKNQDKTKQIAAKRNEKFRTEEHRQHMAKKTAEYRHNNPEADQARLEKVRQTKLVTMQVRQQKLLEIQDRLFAEGKIKKKFNCVSSQQLYVWKKRGLVAQE